MTRLTRLPHQVHDDRIVRDVEIQVDLGAARMGMRRHGVPHATRLELRNTHYEPRALHTAGMDVLSETSLVRAVGRAKVRCHGGASTNARCWITRMRGITHDVEASRPRRVVTLEHHLFAAATYIQHVLGVHGIPMAINDDGALRCNV